ncbi:MAG TPA: hypothetical protein VFG95_04205 [Nitrospiria bacterium]|nr:hypothetical protein [Nitrospiria bacterium]
MALSKKRTFVILGIVFVSIGLVSYLLYVKPTQRSGNPIHHMHDGGMADEFLALIRKQDPGVAFKRLREKIDTNPAMLSSCHSIVHAMGHEAYKKYGDLATAAGYEDDICNSGYLHGVIESYFEHVSDPSAVMKTTCNRYTPGRFAAWECYHGVGHGVMSFTKRDLSRSLDLCDSYEDPLASSSCTNGVFMEYFNMDEHEGRSEFQTDRGPFDRCDMQKPRRKNDCFLYSPQYYLTMHRDDYVGALKWCIGAKKPFHLPCSYGVGNQAIKHHIDDPKFVEGVCMKGRPEQVEPCIDGMVGLYINHFGSLEPAKALCPRLLERNQKVCDAVVKARSVLF